MAYTVKKSKALSILHSENLHSTLKDRLEITSERLLEMVHKFLLQYKCNSFLFKLFGEFHFVGTI